MKFWIVPLSPQKALLWHWWRGFAFVVDILSLLLGNLLSDLFMNQLIAKWRYLLLRLNTSKASFFQILRKDRILLKIASINCNSFLKIWTPFFTLTFIKHLNRQNVSKRIPPFIFFGLLQYLSVLFLEKYNNAAKRNSKDNRRN